MVRAGETLKFKFLLNHVKGTYKKELQLKLRTYAGGVKATPAILKKTFKKD